MIWSMLHAVAWLVAVRGRPARTPHRPVESQRISHRENTLCSCMCGLGTPPDARGSDGDEAREGKRAGRDLQTAEMSA